MVSNPSSTVAHAIRSGRLVRRSCEVCGSKRAVAHHPDYKKPLEVVWLCHSHHRLEHLRLKRERINIGHPPVRVLHIPLPIKVYKKLVKMAAAEDRSLNKFCNLLLERYFGSSREYEAAGTNRQ